MYKRQVEDLLVGFGPGGLADVVDLAIVAVEHDGDPLQACLLTICHLPDAALGLHRKHEIGGALESDP